MRRVLDLYESGVMDRALGASIRPGGLELTRRLAGLIELGRDRLVLDIACGKGSSVALLSQEYGCRALGIDLSRTLLSLAPKGAACLVADGTALPFEGSVFDAVIAECSFSLIADKERAAGEIGRVLKPGGRLAITDVYLRGEVPEERRTGLAFAGCIGGAVKQEDYLRLFARAGFGDPYVEDHSDQLKKAACKVMAAYGTIGNFLAEAGDGSVESWQRLFRDGRPGYALMTFTRL